LDFSNLLQIFFSTFIVVFLMELGDKTQLTAFTLGLKYRSPIKVYLGVITGLAGVTIIAIILGVILKQNIDFEILKPLISLLFIAGGLIFLLNEYRKQNSDVLKICPVSHKTCEKPKENCPEIDRCDLYLDQTVRKNVFLKSFSLIFLAELGDKTMLMSFGLATQFDPYGVFIGAFLALALVNGFGVYFGNEIAKRVPRRALALTSGFLFILTGIFILVL